MAEPGLDALVEQAVAGGTLRASTSYLSALDGADVSLVCVGTPSTACGAADLFYVEYLGAPGLRRGFRVLSPDFGAVPLPGSSYHSRRLDDLMPSADPRRANQTG